MCKKRPALQIEVEFARPMKRVRLGHDCSGVSDGCTLPVQPLRELGPFWATSGCFVSEQRLQAAVEASCCSLGSWGRGAHGMACTERSVSLMHPSGGVNGVEDDDDTLDTASSGSEDGAREQQHFCPPHRQPQAAIGEEDSITSSHPRPAASVAFSFGSRPYLCPDLTAVQCWDVVNDLLAAL